jgi:hypothetical protein
MIISAEQEWSRLDAGTLPGPSRGSVAVIDWSTNPCTAIPIIIEGQFQAFQRFSSSKLVLKTVESCFVALNYYGNGSM